MFPGAMSRCITPRPCMAASAGQLHGQRDQLVGVERLRQLGEARATRVLHHDRVGVSRRVRQLRDAFDAAQPLEHRDLVPSRRCASVPAAPCG